MVIIIFLSELRNRLRACQKPSAVKILSGGGAAAACLVRCWEITGKRKDGMARLLECGCALFRKCVAFLRLVMSPANACKKIIILKKTHLLGLLEDSNVGVFEQQSGRGLRPTKTNPLELLFVYVAYLKRRSTEKKKYALRFGERYYLYAIMLMIVLLLKVPHARVWKY